MHRPDNPTSKMQASPSRANTRSDPNMRRATSQSPSVRHISHRKVNALERKPLLDRANSDIADYQTSLNMPLGRNMILPDIYRDDVESIVYNNGASDTSGNEGYKRSSLTRAVTNDDMNSMRSDYLMGMNLNREDLSWKVILPYYLPFLSWIHHYCPSFFVGDLVAGLSLVFFQLPLSLSYATSLAHVPVICGLYSLAISPLVYMVFGSVPQMIVGPEAAILLIVGQAVEPLLHHYKKKHSEKLDPVDLVVAITFISGASLLGFGLGRFGFLDNVLSASLLKGFISGVGIVMAINSTIVMLGLTELLQEITEDPTKMDIHSPFDKMRFLVHHYKQFHSLTFKISIVAFIVILLCRAFKNYMSKKDSSILKKCVYLPEILFVVIASTCLCAVNRWDKKGIEVIGKITDVSSSQILHNPVAVERWFLIKKLSTPGFLCAMLGFFESTTALKSLGSRYDLPISSNRELVALGALNILVSVFGGLPAFGGYGRSKINAISAKTTMLGAIMGLCTIFTISYLLDALYYVPKCILSAITAVIGILLIDEAPHELWFHWRSRGYNELITFFITVMTTLFFSMEAGIAVGLVYLLIRVIKHSALSRIQILGRIAGSNNFVNADVSHIAPNTGIPFDDIKHPGHPLNIFTDDNFTHLNLKVIEEIEGCLIVKIPEPLTFTNTSDLRGRLKRVEMYGSTRAHPAQKRTRDVSMTKYVVFDLNGMTELDSSAAQILKDLIKRYTNRNIYSFFVRVNEDDELRHRLENTGITKLLAEVLESIKYNEAQNSLTFNKVRDTRKVGDLQHENSDITHPDMNEHMEIYNLTENSHTPYFEHISDVLKVIDYYEIRNELQSRHEFLDVDQAERRSSLPSIDIA